MTRNTSRFTDACVSREEEREKSGWQMRYSSVIFLVLLVTALMTLNISLSETELAPPSFFLEVLSSRQ